MNRGAGVLAAVISGSLVVFLDATVVNVALEAIGADLPASVVGVLEGQAYVVSAYFLALATILILAGAMADRYGRKRMFLVGLGGFAAASALCGLAPTLEALIALRFVQGAAGAFLVPTSLAIIAATFHGPQAGRAYGIWAAASSAAFVVGPTIGGLLVDSVGWPAIFWLNLPVAAVAAGLAIRFVPESRDEHPPEEFDLLGAAAVAIAVGGLAYGAIRGQQSGWTDATAWGALAVGAVTSLGLAPLMRSRPHPLIPPALFASRNFTVINLATLLIYGGIALQSTIQPLFLQGSLGYTALAAGLSTLPAGLLLAIGSTSVGALAGRLGPRVFLVLGPALMATGMLWLARIPESSPGWRAAPGELGSLIPPQAFLVDLLPGLVVYGVGATLMVAPLTQALMASVAQRNAGLGSAINNAVSRIGPLLAVTLAFVAVSATFAAGLEARGVDCCAVQGVELEPFVRVPRAHEWLSNSLRGASTDAFHVAILLAGGLFTAGAIVSGLGLRRGTSPPPDLG